MRTGTRTLRTIAAAAVTMAMFAACEQQLVEPEVDPLTLDEISAERLWDRITQEASYQSYNFWPDEEGVQPGQAPHGQFHRIFVNRALYESVPVSGGQVPYGSIIVKENLDPSQELIDYTVMAKVEGVDPENNDWFWAKYLPDGRVGAAGSVANCIVCHEGMRVNDYIIVRRIDQGLE